MVKYNYRCQNGKNPKWEVHKRIRLEAVKLVTEGELSIPEAGHRLSLPPSTLNTWVKASKTGKLVDVGKNHKPFSEVELALARTKRELAEVKMERDLLKKAAAYS